jgi:hypothetical protein
MESKDEAVWQKFLRITNGYLVMDWNMFLILLIKISLSKF